ncbi:Glycosyl transferase, family 51 [Dillenia turbinata]|uniref:Glycosyl transferase, family 51 n=1 Tax=Dillenia turbinata TaxID=194707 RepID=A0AAN8VTA8_9MAGN
MTSFTLIPRLVTNNPNPPMFLHSFKSIQTPTQIFHFPHKSFLPKTQFHVLGNAVNRQNPSPDLPISQYLRKNSILFTFSLILLSLRLLSNLFLPNFPYRWHCLLSSAQEAEWKVAHYPSHLWQAVVAYEDRRFFKHCGIDPVGIGRAVLSLSARGGGSTITQQRNSQEKEMGSQANDKRSCRV